MTRLVTVIALVATFSVAIVGHSITKRNAFQLCNLINLFADRSCLSYNPYGCFCGYGQEGSESVDNADKCCKIHDDCYGEITKHCRYWYGFLIGYDYRCQGRDCVCLDDDPCSRSTCECDIQLAECLESMNKVKMFSTATDKDIEDTAEECFRSAEDRRGGKRDWRKRKNAQKNSNGIEN